MKIWAKYGRGRSPWKKLPIEETKNQFLIFAQFLGDCFEIMEIGRRDKKTWFRMIEHFVIIVICYSKILLQKNKEKKGKLKHLLS